MARQLWLRLYTEILDNPKLQQLPEKLFKLVINLWCIAKENDGVLPAANTCAFRLHMSREKFARAFEEVSHLFDKLEDGRLSPHDWNEHQYQNDTSNERVKRFRERLRNAECNVTGNASVTPRARAQIQRQRAEADSDPDPSPNGSGVLAAPAFFVSQLSESVTQNLSVVEEEEKIVRWKNETFSKFWANVWSKTGKDAARAVWYRKITSAGMAEIVTAAAIAQGPGLLAAAARADRAALHPRTWLSQGRWMDEQPAAQVRPMHARERSTYDAMEMFMKQGEPS